MTFKKIIKVLVVDDEGVIRDFLGRLFSLEGVDATVVEDGFRAIEKARVELFDIIFIDVRMPKIDGIDTFKQLKKITPQSKFVMMTGYSLDELLKRVEGEHVEAFITKPFDINEIVTILKDYEREKYPDEIISVLIVETEDAVSNFFKKLFKNYDVVSVKTGKEALEKIGQMGFDLVVADIHLVDMNGVELYSKIRDVRPNSRVILVTGDAKKTEDIIKDSLYQQIKHMLNK